MSDQWRRSAFDSEESEPLGPLANLVDIMLVFACGLIAALVALSPELRQHFQLPAAQPVQAGKELTQMPVQLQQQLQQKGEGREGYESLGQVYRDPESGRLILVK
ncbi:DUF2149 domain-containing protein [Thalassolituus sp. UBA2009]|jgi:hypothetical protein|uniref:DUF2149 domain-containing protein n=1 Tax=Thalassolituus sp. UBA2009 TaxID=1947658 RepID=UPI000C57F138|nr:DUF2149 domain-containing protein [Thalassolituus sp. UBA2009]MAY13982.1 hypothetical protein [Oceanospirillaceae bacterium]|tara:strand:+ start:382 stop:696 length:315 start_codon:yes stop_codon:yes gene_type:complete